MSIASACVLLLVAACVVASLLALFMPRRSPAIAALAILAALAAALGAWYAWVESRSLPWTLVFAHLLALEAGVAARHLVRGRPAHE